MDILHECSVIIVEKHLNKTLGMNLTAKELFEEINEFKEKNVVLDFTGVLMVGRSFTQEYIYQKMISEKTVYEINMSEDVEKMFEVVKKDYE